MTVGTNQTEYFCIFSSVVYPPFLKREAEKFKESEKARKGNCPLPLLSVLLLVTQKYFELKKKIIGYLLCVTTHPGMIVYYQHCTASQPFSRADR